MTDIIDISEHTNAIAKALGHEPSRIRSMLITPDAIHVTLYELNENGAKYVREDGNVATFSEDRIIRT